MATKKCPGCGARFSGKRCPECYYTPFDAPEIPQLHAKETSRPVESRKLPQREYRPVRRHGTGRAKATWVLIVSAVIIFLSLVGGILMAATRSIISNISYSMAEPETVPLPEDGLVLYDADDIRIILGWDGGEITGDIPVYLENNSDRDVDACTAGVAVNGVMTDDVFFYIDARRDAVSMSQLWIDAEELKKRGIQTIGEIKLELEVRDGLSYEQMNDPEMLTFGPGGGRENLDDSGEVVLEDNGIKLVYQGIGVNEWDEICLQFYAENNTGKPLNLTSHELLINGEDSGQYLWQDFFLHTKAVLQVELYEAEALGIQKPEDVEKLEFRVNAVVDERWDEEYVSDPIVIQTRKGR